MITNKKMMRNPYQRKSKSSLLNAPILPKEQYIQFIVAVVAQAKVYGLYHDGWALCATPSGQQTLAVWHQKSLAQLLVRDKWAGYMIEEISLNDFVDKMIPYIRQNNTHLSINLMPEGQNILVSGRQFLGDLKAYLYDMYAKDPSRFKDSSLPLPRKIRVHA